MIFFKPNNQKPVGGGLTSLKFKVISPRLTRLGRESEKLIVNVFVFLKCRFSRRFLLRQNSLYILLK